MDFQKVVQSFGFTCDEAPISIYPFSPVFHVKLCEQQFIIKCTQTNPTSLVHYLNMLKQHNIKVVTPVPLDVPNPQKIGDNTFIVYPFIEGTLYQGTDEQLIAVGEHLGKIHAASPPTNVCELPVYDVYDFYNHEVEDAIDVLCEYSQANQVMLDIQQVKQLWLAAIKNQEALQLLKLPHVATPHDYKATNIVMTPTPFLIDPDNASFVPRIFDLALTLLLFHNEQSQAPHRVFTVQEWQLFLTGYSKYIKLTQVEIEWWEAAKQHVFLDDVMWLMTANEEDWRNPAQQTLFQSIVQVMTHSEAYQLFLR